MTKAVPWVLNIMFMKIKMVTSGCISQKRGVVLETEIFAGGIKNITPKKISASTYFLTGKELKIILESKYFEIIKL